MRDPTREPTQDATQDGTTVESGTLGRVAFARIAPNEDLVRSVEAVCRAHGFRHAFVRGALGSLVDACLRRQDGSVLRVDGTAVEIVSLAGDVRPGDGGEPAAVLSGVVADTRGQLAGGFFVADANTVCMTFEITLEEWLPGVPATPAASPPTTHPTRTAP